MKVIHVTSKSLGGSGKYIEVLSKGLKKLDVQTVLAFFPTGAKQDSEIISGFDEVFEFKRKPSMNPFSLLMIAFQLRGLIKSSNIDVVHTHTSLGGVIGRLATVGLHVPTVHTIHAYGADEFTPIPQKWFYAFIEKTLDLLTTKYISPSKYMVDYGVKEKIISKEKANVIYNSLPLKSPDFEKNHQIRKNFRRLHSVDETTTILLFCGRLEPQKGFDILLKALSELSIGDPDYLLFVCGSGDCFDRYKQMSIDLNIEGKIRWCGWQSDLTSFYASSDIYVMPSRWESFGLVFLEAMNYKLPIVSTKTQAIPEVVENNITGLLSKNEDTVELSINIETLINNPSLREAYGNNGFDRLNEKFLFDDFILKIFNLYSSLKDSKYK